MCRVGHAIVAVIYAASTRCPLVHTSWLLLCGVPLCIMVKTGIAILLNFCTLVYKYQGFLSEFWSRGVKMGYNGFLGGRSIILLEAKHMDT